MNRWHNNTAPDFKDEVVRRILLINKLADDPVLLAKIKKHYSKNPVDFINDFCITLNPRNEYPMPKKMPFILFPRQVEFVNFLYQCYIVKESGLVEKCRDVGASWLCCAFAFWMWLFVDGSSIGFGSRLADLVDKLGEPDSIFEKIRVLISNTPKFMLPDGFDYSRHCFYMRIINPENGATIKGESGDNIGRGGRSTLYVKDESAHYERPELIEAALGDNTDVQIDISSVNGIGNVFYRRRMAGEIWMPDKPMPKGKTRVFIFDWRDHPLKNQEWYDMRRKKAEEEGMLHIFAQEVDRDYSASVEGVIIPAKWVKAAIDAHIKLNFTASGEKCAGQDVADEGGDKHAFAWRHGVILQDAQHWGEGDGGDACRKVLPWCAENKITDLYYDCIGVGASFKTEANRIKELGQLPKHLEVHKWNAAESPQDAEKPIIEGDKDSPLNGDYFMNLKVQSWWRLRTRFEKTYKSVTQGAVYPHEDLISIPSTLENRHKIEEELSQAVYKRNSNGKLLVDKKPDGALSPNLADAIVICYNPKRKFRGFFA